VFGGVGKEGWVVDREPEETTVGKDVVDDEADEVEVKDVVDNVGVERVELDGVKDKGEETAVGTAGRGGKLGEVGVQGKETVKYADS
jgi:hypothetical protein